MRLRTLRVGTLALLWSGIYQSNSEQPHTKLFIQPLHAKSTFQASRQISPDVHWHEDYELPLAQHTYDLAFALTEGFTRVTLHDLVRTITSEPTTLRVFRLILGFTAQEFAAATVLVGNSEEEKALTVGSVRGIEGGSAAKARAVERCAAVIDLGGIPLFAVLAGLGWTRTADALGPVVRDTDGRTFTIPTLQEMLTVQPFPSLVNTQF